MKKFFGYLFLVFGMAFALSYFQNSSVNALDGSYDDAIMGQSSHIDQDENKIEDAKEENSYSLRTMIQNGWFYQGNKKCFRDNDGHVIGENVKKVIDVSQYNGHIDWSKVSKTDVDGVIIRIVSHKGGYYHIDKQFENNLNGCRKYNIPFGIYIYDYSNNVTDADNEAKMILNYLSIYKISPSELSYPVYLDMERPELSTTTNELVVDAFVNKLANGNYNTKVYSYRSLLQTKLNSPTIYQHVDWVAAYTSSLGFSNNWYRGPKGWQYSNGAFVDGISGYVDMSVWYDQGVSKYDYVGWKYYYDHWYYGSSKNILQIGWENINGKWYYFNTNGIMATGWISLNGEWYYLTSNGDMVTGAQTINNKEYYFTSEGVMVRGWHKENDKWKYYSPKKMSIYGRTFVEGEKVTGWLPINDKWYYIAEDGSMVTGIYKVGNRKYLFMEDGSKKTPVMIHRACFGSIERFIGIITEHFAGAFPLWLAPKQVTIIPVNNDAHLAYAKEIEEILINAGIRVSIDDREEKLNYKIRETQVKKIPYTLVLGDQEQTIQLLIVIMVLTNHLICQLMILSIC